jgi:hypothetical protein
MIMEKRKAMQVVAYFTVGLLGGWLIGTIAPIEGIGPAVPVNAEYYLELKGDSAIVVGRWSHFKCPIDSLPNEFIKDNL